MSIKKTILCTLLAATFFTGYYAASGDPMSGTITAIDNDMVTITDVCGREFTFKGAEDYDIDDNVAFIIHGDHVLRVRYTG